MNNIIKYCTAFLFSILLNTNSQACTNILVSKGASKDGSCMISYAADSHELYGELYFWPSENYLEGSMLDIYEWDTKKYLGKIPQVKHTYQVVGNMNEYQLAISETTYTGREELRDSTGLLDYGSLIYVTLQREKTAKDAIKTIVNLANEYGYYSTGESFSIADKEEVWIMDLIGKGPDNKGIVWVARKLPEGYISAHANHSRISTFPLDDKENTMYAPDVISFARSKGYFSGKDKDFNFSAAYAPADYGALRFCESRVWSVFNRVNSKMGKYLDYAMGDTNKQVMPLWIKPDKQLTAKDVIGLMRDHFEGTPMDMTKDIGAGEYKCPYRWRPLIWDIDSVKYINERAISTQQTGFSFISQSRSNYPDIIGGIQWFGVDDTYSTCYIPVYCGIKNSPKPYAVGTGSFHEFSWESAFWVFNFVSNFAYMRYNEMIVDILAVQKKHEDKFFALQPIIEKSATELYHSDPELAKVFITEYTNEQANIVRDDWLKLGEFLLYKYLDGNVKDKDGNVTHPPYPEEYYQKIIKQTGDFFQYK